MNIAVILTHNLTEADNEAQIKTLLNLLTSHEIADGEIFTHYYTFNDILEDHQVAVYQILPYGVKEPTNFHSIDSHNVLYRKGDEDKIGDHPRFFNWGLKRATDYGADLVVKIDDISTFDPKELILDTPPDLVTQDFGVIATKTVQEVHDPKTAVLDESLSTIDGLTDLATTVSLIGLEVTIG